jgi:hypothetical protein
VKGMKRDRDLIQMSRSKLSVEQIAAKLKSTPKTVFMAGRRLGIYFPPLKRKTDGRHKRK